MGQVREHTMRRRLELLAILATAVRPLAPADVIGELRDDILTDTEQGRRRVFFFDVAWLRHELGCDILYDRRAHGYRLLAVPSWLLDLAGALGEWRSLDPVARWPSRGTGRPSGSPAGDRP